MNYSEPVNSALLESLTPLSRDTKRLFINRELSWIEFNRRVLFEAQRVSTPLLERVKFLGILSANVDEFYMKRLGGLKQKIARGDEKSSIDGLTPREQLEQCSLALLALQEEKELEFCRIRQEMLHHDIQICDYSSLEGMEKASLDNYYVSKVQEHITCSIVDPTQPFPFLSNLSLYLLVSIKHPADHTASLALVKVPVGKALPRFVRVDKSQKYVLLENVIAAHAGGLFPHAHIVSSDVFRITRSAVSYRDYTELNDQREIIEEELHDRKYASVVRLQVSPLMKKGLRCSLASSLGLNDSKDVSQSVQLLRMSDLRELASLNIPKLRDIPHKPIISASLSSQASILETIYKRTSVVLQHPYESFSESVEGFVREVSEDPQVTSIKMTLYRTSEDTRIADYLIAAAVSGKQVSAVVELNARFDEASNLRWARRLESAGVQISHGISGLKTHCKFILVVKKDKDRLRRYAHIATGNYHAGTAQLYADIGLFTCDVLLTADIAELFTYLTTANNKICHFNQILATPYVIKEALLAKIEREINRHSDTAHGYICMKTNALEDPDITLALYRASQAGVKVDLIVRDICRLRPGILGVSENIRVISIVGRFLEHSRLYRFGNGDDDELYMGSADLMTRNLERRVEVLIPIIDERSKRQLCGVLNQHLRDNCCAWIMQADGRYVKKERGSNEILINSQSRVAEISQTHATSNRLKPKKLESSRELAKETGLHNHLSCI